MSVFETGAEEAAYDKGFDHGEEFGFADGIDFEQDRIIKLIEGKGAVGVDAIIALIKGKAE